MNYDIAHQNFGLLKNMEHLSTLEDIEKMRFTTLCFQMEKFKNSRGYVPYKKKREKNENNFLLTILPGPYHPYITLSANGVLLDPLKELANCLPTADLQAKKYDELKFDTYDGFYRTCGLYYGKDLIQNNREEIENNVRIIDQLTTQRYEEFVPQLLDLIDQRSPKALFLAALRLQIRNVMVSVDKQAEGHLITALLLHTALNDHQAKLENCLTLVYKIDE